MKNESAGVPERSQRNGHSHVATPKIVNAENRRGVVKEMGGDCGEESSNTSSRGRSTVDLAITV